MSIEVAVICDECGSLIDSSRTATQARRNIRESNRASVDGRLARVGLPGGRDLCWDCGPRSLSPDALPTEED